MATKKDNKAAKAAPAVQTTVKVNDKVAKAIEVIKEHHPHVKVAYFNADGEYHFHKRKGFAAVTIIDEDSDEPNLAAETEGDELEEPTDPNGGKLEF
jgi:uncharacterized FlaG/YvyC family protein